MLKWFIFIRNKIRHSEKKVSKDFILPNDDVFYLEQCGKKWETIKETLYSYYVIIHDYAIPEGYNVSKADIALRIEGGYPVSQIEMAYFYPKLHIKGRNIICGTGYEIKLKGRRWQRWSRHRTGHNPWRPGTDNIQTHLLMVNWWLERELKHKSKYE